MRAFKKYQARESIQPAREAVNSHKAHLILTLTCDSFAEMKLHLDDLKSSTMPSRRLRWN